MLLTESPNTQAEKDYMQYMIGMFLDWRVLSLVALWLYYENKALANLFDFYWQFLIAN